MTECEIGRDRGVRVVCLFKQKTEYEIEYGLVGSEMCIRDSFQAFQVRVLTGLVKPDDADDAAAEKLRLKHEDLLVLESPDSSASVLPLSLIHI